MNCKPVNPLYSNFRHLHLHGQQLEYVRIDETDKHQKMAELLDELDFNLVLLKQ